MKSIDYLNKYNPLALFGITESTDRTADEISQRKMSKKWADYRCDAQRVRWDGGVVESSCAFDQSKMRSE